MKRVIAFAAALAVFVGSAGTVAAAPFKAADKNPNVVAHHDHPDDYHGITGIDGSKDNDMLVQGGRDLVMAAGKSGNFQQWWEKDGVGYHSVFRHVGSDTSCSDDWVWLENPVNPPYGETWGFYLEEGNYCVKTNEYTSGQTK